MGVVRQTDTNTGAGTGRASRIVPRPLKVLSFGYRYPRTAPVGADVVMDARCLCEDPAEKRRRETVRSSPDMVDAGRTVARFAIALTVGVRQLR